MKVLLIAVGAFLVLGTYSDAVSTLVTTRIRRGRLSPTAFYYRRSFPRWRAIALRVKDDDRRDSILAAYGPLSLIGLLVLWISLQLIGWSLIWLALRHELSGVQDWWDSIYYAGVGFFTIGFGDIVPKSGAARPLTLLQAFFGVTTSALVIGYLPTLYGAYSDRERLLPTLDDLSGADVVTPVGLLRTYTPAGNAAPLAALFRDWQKWCAEVEQTHAAYPMLVFFRSKPGESWIAALALVADAAVLAIAAVDDPRMFEPTMMYRRVVRTVSGVGRVAPRLTRQVVAPAIEHDEAAFRTLYEDLGRAGVRVHPYADAWAAVQRMRAEYRPQLERLAWMLVAPMDLAARAAHHPHPDAT